MCGITGFWDSYPTKSKHWMGKIIQQMLYPLIHRGPDDEGIWSDEVAGIALGHRRLAIVDLSPEGHQPMLSADERYALVFNGEIYNFLELRYQLKQLGHHFRGHSDTEVMLTAFSQWGVEAALQCFIGMFAFALWDRQESALFLGRDRLGEKPLYYGWIGETFLFASELKAFKAHPQWQPEIDRDPLALLLRYNYITAPYSIYKGIYKLPPGTFLTLTTHSLSGAAKSIPQPTTYWSMQGVAEAGVRSPFTGSDTEATEQLEHLLTDAIRRQMVADVPLGAFLSGGIDSSTIVALMQAESSQPIKTFTIGFDEEGYNEANYAKAVAEYLGCAHTELYITPETAIAIIPKLPTLYDEPFADSSQIPTFMVAQLAKQQVTVSLSGDGGDEIFGGYTQYFWGRGIWRSLGWLPASWRCTVAQMITTLSPDTWNSLFAAFPLSGFTYFPPGDSLYRLVAVLSEKQPEAIYRHLMSQWQNPEAVVIGATESTTALNNPQRWADLSDLFQGMMYLDSITELPDDILTKVDRATMGVSLESRAPFLDHRVVEFAWRLPLSLKVRQGKGKWLLRQLLSRYIPQSLLERPKKGFDIPLDNWLREGKLRDWAEALLSEHRLKSEGFFKPQLIRQKWVEHLSGRYNWQSHLWNVLMFQAWLEEQ
ncbi:MAG: asparagine synthase (glutamine-hydrolyzing) [Xenococcaceae cyanobacterium]